MAVDGMSGQSFGNKVGNQEEGQKQNAEGQQDMAIDAKNSGSRGQRSNQLLERNHDLHQRMPEGSTYWLQNKDRVVLDVKGIAVVIMLSLMVFSLMTTVKSLQNKFCSLCLSSNGYRRKEFSIKEYTKLMKRGSCSLTKCKI